MNKQESAWKGEFGDAYNERNDMTPEEINKLYLKLYGIKRSDLNELLIGSTYTEYVDILEVGCGTGNQLALVAYGFPKESLHGIDTNEAAVKIAKERGFDVQVGSAFDLPYPDNSFDLVFTSGLLIHIDFPDLHDVQSEIVRVSKRFVWGLEYYSFSRAEIQYRNRPAMLWKDDYARHYRVYGLKLLREIRLVRLDGSGVDTMFLLEKKS